MSPKASIIITAHNYGHFLEDCLDSALSQTYDNYEVIVVDDGSSDNTPEILADYEYKYSDQITTIRLEGEGVSAASNTGIDRASGKYVMRLDADDFIDENLLTVQISYLESHDDVDLVYPDYYTTDEDGEILDHVKLPNIGEEVKLLSRLPIGTACLFEKQKWSALGGYNEEYYYQEDYDFWIRFTNKFRVQSIDLPLLYYRQHGSSKSSNKLDRLSAKRDVKKEFVKENLSDKVEEYEVLCVIPAKNEQRIERKNGSESSPLAMLELDEKPLIEYTISEALAAEQVDRVIVSTESEEIAETSSEVGADVPYLRDPELSKPSVMLSEVLADLVQKLDGEEDYEPDLIVLTQYLSPLKTSGHIDEAVETKLMFDVDSVISVTKNNKFMWQPGKYGLEPLFDERLLREDRENLYQENGAISVFRPQLLFDKSDIVGDRVGHINMGSTSSVHIDTRYDFWLCKKIIESNDESINPNYNSNL